ncbi:MAG TPA: UGSC family (seleno)protein [Burkholderiales bacterium]|nr:UGSC family (seleno)protein [Burkholderiales bacterium]
MGHADIPIAVIPHPFGLRRRDEVRRIAEESVEEIVRLVLGKDRGVTEQSSAPDIAAQHAAVVEVAADIETFNDYAQTQRWSDGLPLIPPTVARVERMLRHTRRHATDVVAILAPGFGAATIERIAVNAVMAGCRPEYLPVLIAVVEAMAERKFNLQGIQATTNPATPWIIVNGPVARKLHLNAGPNCLGQGSRPNSSIGRAVRLILQNIGGALPGDMDRATHGQPGKHTFCCAENEADSPWSPLHVDRGYAIGENTVTVVGAAGTLNLNSHSKEADDLLRVFADSMTFPTSNDFHFGGEPWLVISPEHAEVLKRGGFEKTEVREHLWKQARMRAERFAAKDYARAAHTRGGELGVLTADTLVPVSRTAQDIGIVVAGGPGTHSVYVPTFGQTRSVTRPIP